MQKPIILFRIQWVFLMTFKYDNVSLMDFQRIDELHDIGYNRTISMMDSIKSRIQRRVNLDNIRLRRMVYRSNYPNYALKTSLIDGANPQQQAYIKKNFIALTIRNSLTKT